MARTRIGELRHRIIIQNKTQAPDGYGGTIDTWANQATVWAKIEAVSSHEILSASSPIVKFTHLVTIRYRADVRGESRIKFGDRCFSVKGFVNPGERDRFLEIQVEELSGRVPD